MVWFVFCYATSLRVLPLMRRRAGMYLPLAIPFPVCVSHFSCEGEANWTIALVRNPRFPGCCCYCWWWRCLNSTKLSSNCMYSSFHSKLKIFVLRYLAEFLISVSYIHNCLGITNVETHQDLVFRINGFIFLSRPHFCQFFILFVYCSRFHSSYAYF